MHVALFETDAMTVLDVDRGDDLHSSHVTAGGDARMFSSGEAKRNCSRSGASVPGYEVGKQLKPGAVAFLRMELHGKDISLRYCASKRRWICRGPRPDLRVGRRRIIAVREIEARRVGNLRPERMRPRLPDRTPPHVRHLEPVTGSRQHVFITKAHDAALYNAQ